MVACETCGASSLLMVNVALGSDGPTYTYRCPDGHITHTDFRSPPQDQARQPSDVAPGPVTPPSPPLPDGGVAGSPPQT